MGKQPIIVYVLILSLVLAAASSGSTCCKVRFATFNTSLNRNKAGQLLAELQSGKSAQAANVSAILQTIRPDVLLLNEFDYEPGNAAVEAFQDNFLGVSQAPGLQPLRYPYVFTAPVNTGVPSGRDFDHDGKTDGPADAFGYGFHSGQYGMVLLSQFPIDAEAARTFQHFLYKDMPGALLPTDPRTGQPWYSSDDLQVLRLSSKSHWDVPMTIPLDAEASVTKRMHMLLHHPTPPAFDGAEGRNHLRNHDEIRLFADYVGCQQRPAPNAAPVTTVKRVTGSSSRTTSGPHSGTLGLCKEVHVLDVVCDAVLGAWQWLQGKLGGRMLLLQQQQLRHLAGAAAYMYDDAGKHGGLAPGSSFVIAGDHNADPLDGNSHQHAISQLLECDNITADFTPSSEGGKEAGNKHPTDRTPPETKTSTFDLRVDYILPSRDMKVLGGAVFWPVKAQQPEAGWIQASDHRPVYLDVEVCAEGQAVI